jgi:hypothetical protein
MRGFIAAALVGATALLAFASTALSITTVTTPNGTWTAYPGQSTSYSAAIQQPIESGNTSNWSSKSKGAIPIMFKLSSGLGPFVFESIYSDNTSVNDGDGTCGTGSGADHANDCSFLTFTPNSTVTFNDIAQLASRYLFTLGDCHGGALRWSVRTSPSQSVFIYYGNPPQFGNGGVDGCTSSANGGVNQSGSNLIGLSDLRYDTSQYAGGTFYDTYAHAQTLVGTTPILRASLVLDAGWGGNQRLTLTDATVQTGTFTDTFTPTASSTLAPTCNLPTATLKMTRIDPQPDGDVNESPVQQSFDNGNVFRVVDCKYQYNLAIPALPGSGTYKVEIQIGGNTVGTAYFDLK